MPVTSISRIDTLPVAYAIAFGAVEIGIMNPNDEPIAAANTAGASGVCVDVASADATGTINVADAVFDASSLRTRLAAVMSATIANVVEAPVTSTSALPH